MNDTLVLNYNINFDKLDKISDSEYLFYDDIYKYYFVLLNRPSSDIYAINNILNRSIYHTIIPNNKGILTTKYDNKEYILIRLNTSEHIEINIEDILKNNIIIKENIPNLDRTNYSKLWESKIDYLEYQISELGKNHKLILESFSYFLGLGENAIENFNSLNIKNITKVVSHRRIDYPNYSLNFFNPLEVIIDYRIRDIAEYIKSSFFKDKIVLDEINKLIDSNILTSLEYNLLFVRLLYPSNYFDDIYNILERGFDDNILLKYINRIDAYEEYLNKIYKLIHKKTPLLKIEWLIK